MMGVEYNGISNTTPSDIVVTDPSHWLFNGVGVSDGSLLPGVLEYETDGISPYAPAGTISVAHSPFPKGAPRVYADVTLYTAASGANVFAAGSIWWVTGLDSYSPSRGVVPAVQQITANFISRALQGTGGPPPAIGRLPATVTTSSAAAGYPASNAGDGDAATQWVASLNSSDPNNNNAWIQLDFGARMGLQDVRWRGAGGSPYPAWSPTNYSIQISDDAVTWQTVVTRSNPLPVVTGNEPLSAQARFLRMLTSKVGDGTGWSLSFFESWAEGPVAPVGPTLSALALAPTSVTGTSPSTGTVTLSGPAPAGGAAVTLASDTPAVASVPGSVTVPAGASSATFTVNTTAVAASTTVAISASYSGGTQNASLTVLPPALSALALSPTSVTGGSASTGTATLNAPAPGGGAAVSLSSNAAAASVPGSVTIPAGATSATFTVTTIAVAASTTATISGSYGSTQTASLTVIPPVLSALALSPTSVTGGSSSTGTVTLNGPAPAGGAVVALSSNNTNATTVPPSVTVAAGSTTATFTVTTKTVVFSTVVTISGSFNGSNQSANLTVMSGVPGL